MRRMFYTHKHRPNRIASRAPRAVLKIRQRIPSGDRGSYDDVSSDMCLPICVFQYRNKVHIQTQSLLQNHTHTHALPLFHSSLHGVQKDSALVAGFLQLRTTLLLRECRRIHCVLKLLNQIAASRKYYRNAFSSLSTSPPKIRADRLLEYQKK